VDADSANFVSRGRASTGLMKNRARTCLFAAALSLPFLVLLPSSCDDNRREDGLLDNLKALGEKNRWCVLLQQSGVECFEIGTGVVKSLYSVEIDDRNANYVGMASFSPDGRKITFAQSWGSSRALLVYDLVSHSTQPLTELRYIEGPRWAPDGDKIAFEGREQNSGNYTLRVYSISRKTVETISSAETGERNSISWGPGGRSLVYQDSGNGIWLLDLATKEKKKLAIGRLPRCSPDGKFVSFFPGKRDGEGLSIYDMQSEQVRTILDGEPIFPIVAWSPDSRYIVYSRASKGVLDYLVGSLGEAEHFRDLCVFDINSGTRVKVGTGGSFFPSDWGSTAMQR
jgi:Tol biopolymer transport system component